MTDPIRPYVNIIESIARSRKASAADESLPHAPPQQQRSESNGDPSIAGIRFAERLTTRLSAIDKNDQKRRRQAFVELALISELGEQLGLDIGLSELVDKVSTIIASDQEMAIGLDNMLNDIQS